ncbi:hypothetical protein [Bradyrhizobium phage BDU-MI-1]|nr:hypothetical protein [Bradyrhizobium phage BDU-MI-1]
MTTNDDDYIPFEGPLWDSRGPKKVSPEDAKKLRDLVLKLKLNQAERWRRASQGRPASRDRGQREP